MSGNSRSIPDAWDDDWEMQADVKNSPLYHMLDLCADIVHGRSRRLTSACLHQKPEKEPETQQRISKAERLAKHAEQNKTLWDSA